MEHSMIKARVLVACEPHLLTSTLRPPVIRPFPFSATLPLLCISQPFSQAQRRGRRKSAWYTLLRLCSYVYWLMCYLPRDKTQERIGCLQWVHLWRKCTFMRLSTISSKSISTTAYQTFLFVSDSIKLGRACSSDFYSVLRTKAEVFFKTVYAIYVNRWLSY